MNTTSRWIGLGCALALLAACESDDSTSADVAAVSADDSTTTAAAGPPSTASGITTTTTVAPAPSASPVPGTAGDGSSGNDETDPATGLAPGPVGVVPPGVLVGERADQRATLVIAAFELSLDRDDGSCSTIDGVTYVQVGASGGPQGVLLWDAGTGANPFMTWQVGGPDTAMITNHGLGDTGLTLVLDEGERSGTFTGWFNVPVGTSANFRELSGRFDCSSSPLTIEGLYPLTLGATTCSADGTRLSSGGDGDAALLTIDPSTRTAAGGFEGSLSWRVGGQTHQTVWLSGRSFGDPPTISFIALVRGSDGAETSVSGSLRCTG